MTSADDVPPKKEQLKWLYAKLRRRIESGEWPHRYVVPSEKELEALNTLSVRTNRDAIIELAAIGRVIKHHGRKSVVYMPDDEPHRLAVNLPEPLSVHLADVAEPDSQYGPAVMFIPAEGSNVGSEWFGGEYKVPAWDRKRLGIATGTELVTRTLVLSVDGEPVLLSTSLVPPELLGGSVRWADAAVGELALTGVSVEFDRGRVKSRIPTLEEFETVGGVPGTPALAVYRPCRLAPAGSTSSVAACVLVVARGDLVRL